MSNAATVPMVWPGRPNVRLADPVTSHEAADLSDEEKSIGLVLSILKANPGGLADHQVEAIAVERGEKFSGQRLRTARAALVERGLVEDTDRKIRTPKNRRTTVWAVTA
jgi:hypothetical protein